MLSNNKLFSNKLDFIYRNKFNMGAYKEMRIRSYTINEAIWNGAILFVIN